MKPNRRFFVIGLLALTSTLVNAQRQPPVKPAARLQPPAKPAPPIIERDLTRLPAAVAKMRERILEAARSGDIEQMRLAIEVNELPPMFVRNAKSPGDPVERLKSLSSDAEGRQVLARLVNALEHGFAILEKGRDGEVFVFPWFAAIAPDVWRPEEWVEVWRVAPVDIVNESREKNRFLGDRLAIGRDGTWHYFVSGD